MLDQLPLLVTVVELQQPGQDDQSRGQVLFQNSASITFFGDARTRPAVTSPRVGNQQQQQHKWHHQDRGNAVEMAMFQLQPDAYGLMMAKVHAGGEWSSVLKVPASTAAAAAASDAGGMPPSGKAGELVSWVLRHAVCCMQLAPCAYDSCQQRILLLLQA